MFDCLTMARSSFRLSRGAALMSEAREAGDR